jgi:hypothetical protein
MSVTAGQLDPNQFLEGEDRYVRFAEDVLGLTLTREQKRVLRAVVEHERVIIESGNGVGKSYIVAVLKLAFVCTNLDSTVLGTSGSYSQYVDAVWRPMKTLHREAKQRVGLPGETYDGGQPTLEIDDDWFAKVVSPRDPGDLEGRHAESMLVVIEEADKAYITDEHFDSAGSSITDDNDRMVAICNPPKDESNAVHERLESGRWHTIRFSSLDSHNVRVDAGELEAEKIPGLIDLETIQEDWEAWNGEPWPGLEEARRVSDPDRSAFRTDLDERWYRRRAGVMPPAGAAAHRPIYVDDVEAAWDRDHPHLTTGPSGSGIDVARSGDRTVLETARFRTDGRPGPIDVKYSEQGTNHATQESTLRDLLEQWPDHPTPVDAVGEGSALADSLQEAYPEVIRFKAGGTPTEDTEYDDCWAEGLASLGQWLRDGGSIDDRRLREELLIAARTVTFEERHLASRGQDGADVLTATSKEAIKERLGRSPDHLDAAMMAAWAANGNATGRTKTVRRRSGSSPTKGNLR